MYPLEYGSKNTLVNTGAAVASYATKWNEGAYNVNRVDFDGISEENKDLALAHMDYLFS